MLRCTGLHDARRGLILSGYIVCVYPSEKGGGTGHILSTEEISKYFLFASAVNRGNNIYSKDSVRWTIYTSHVTVLMKLNLCLWRTRVLSLWSCCVNITTLSGLSESMQVVINPVIVLFLGRGERLSSKASRMRSGKGK